MSVSDEILKLKQLLDSGAITQEEFETMKAGLLKNNSTVQTPVTTPQRPLSQYPQTSQYQRPMNQSTYYYRKRYFNDTPFKVVGWISFGFAALFSIIIIFLLVNHQYQAAVTMVWETSFIPGTLSIIMGAILARKSCGPTLLILGISITILTFVLSMASSITYANNIAKDIYYYL